MKVLASSFVILGLAAGPAWAYRDKKVEEAVLKAEGLIAKGRTDEAAKSIQKAAQSLKTGEAYVALGRIQEKTGTSLDEAAASYATAKDLGAGDSEVLTAVALFELQAASGKQALGTANAAASAAGAGPEARAAQSLALSATQDFSQGLKTAEALLAASPSLALAHEAKGQALLVSGNTGAAVASLRKAVELDGQSVSALVRLSTALLADGKGAEAETSAKRALEINKNSGVAMAAKAVAIVAVDTKRWSEAIAEAQQGAFVNTKSAFVQFCVGKVFEANNNFDQASQSYQKALEADPGYVQARLALIGAQNLRGDLKGALAEAQKLVKDLPASGDAHFLLGKAYISAKDFKSAEPALAKAAELSPGNAEAHAYLAAINFQNGKDALALESYKKALALKPENASWRSDYALLLARSGNAVDGLRELRKVVDAPGYSDPTGFVNMGYLYRNMEPPKTDEAAAAYQKALQMKPKEDLAAQANLGLGWAYLSAKKYDLAIPPYEQVVKLDPKLAPEAYNGMGWCYLFKRDVPQAKAMVSKAKDAGRIDSRLAESVEKFEAAIAKGKAKYDEFLRIAEEQRILAAKLAAIAPDAESASAAARKRAVLAFAKLGPVAAERLVFILSADRDLTVRADAASALGTMGQAAVAAGAVKYLQSYVRLECRPDIFAADIEQEVACVDLRNNSRAVLKKLGL